MSDDRRAAFMAEVKKAIESGAFVALVLSAQRDRAAPLRSVHVRRIERRGQAALSLSYREQTRDVTKNLPLEAGLAAVAALIDRPAAPSFAQATLQESEATVELRVSRAGQATLRRRARPMALAPAPVPAFAHDRLRQRQLSLELPIWRELGIADAAGRLVPALAGKWRQIDKFVEILAAAVAATPELAAAAAQRPLRVVDYGAGKGYLTFAMTAFLVGRFGAADLTGVELRADLVEHGNAAAARAGLAGIRFVEGDLRSVAPAAADIVIALHACDTATDHALALGVGAQAAILVCSPCCHRELRPQLAVPEALRAVMRHGIHRGQEAEMVTDSLRALLLERCGYRAQVFEFVSLEHTRKNKMILATRRAADPARAAAAQRQLDDIKSFYGIRAQCLETLLLGPAAPSAQAPTATG